MREESEEAEGRRRLVAGLFDTRAASVALLAAFVLITQAGLVYVAVDQIGSSDEPNLVQPARSSRIPNAPISVEADTQRRVPAPAATRTAEAVEAEGTPDEAAGPPEGTGLDLAGEQADPQGVAPPLTGDEPPRAEAAEDPPAPRSASEEPQGDGTGSHPTPSASPSDNSDPHDHQEQASEPPAEDQETQHGRHDHGAQDHEPPGQGGDNPGNGTGGGDGGNGGG